MKVQGKNYQTLWLEDEASGLLRMIDQTLLPHVFAIRDLRTWEDSVQAIQGMSIRGAIVLGVAAGFAMYQAALAALSYPDYDAYLFSAAERIKATRPTAVNIAWAVERQRQVILQGKTREEKIALALHTAKSIAQQELEACRQIGLQGLPVLRNLQSLKPSKPLQILTHCNAGWLACVDYGTATAPIYAAWEQGLDLHVWVDETRPLNQGSRLTAWELGQHGIPHTIIVDNAGGHLMQEGQVDLVIVGADRVTRQGDVANKIGTYLKALAAQDNGVPFYAVFPSSSFDWNFSPGGKKIPIEERSAEEVKYISGWVEGEIKQVLLTPTSSPAANYGFDVTPARLVTGLITERGVCRANPDSIASLFPDQRE